MQIDFNVDAGEGFKIEAKIMPFISSCNIACGGHAGNSQSMNEVVRLAKEHNVRIGAHPSFHDKKGFGRRLLFVEVDDLKVMIIKQVSKLVDIAAKYDKTVDYIKPHGALYHAVCHSERYSKMMVEIIKDHFPHMKLMIMPNNLMQEIAEKNDIDLIREGFADRKYEGEKILRKRELPGSVIHDVEEVKEQVKSLVLYKMMTTYHDEEYIYDTDTICFHGDHANSVKIIEEVATFMGKLNIKVGI